MPGQVTVVAWLVLARDRRSRGWLAVNVARCRTRRPGPEELADGERLVRLELRVPRSWFERREPPSFRIELPEDPGGPEEAPSAVAAPVEPRPACTCDFTAEEMEAASAPWHRLGCPQGGQE